MMKECPICTGTGKALDVNRWPEPTHAVPATCFACEGTGTVPMDLHASAAAYDSHPEPRADAPVRAGAHALAGYDEAYEDYRKSVDDSGPSEDFEAGAEAMRKACLHAVDNVCNREVLDPAIRRIIRTAIEGATP